MEILLAVGVLLQLIAVVLLVFVFRKPTRSDAGAWDALEKKQERLEAIVREEMVANRRESSDQARLAREESVHLLTRFGQSLTQQAQDAATLQDKRFEGFETRLQALGVNTTHQIAQMRELLDEKLKAVLDESARRWDEKRAEDGKAANLARQELHEALGRLADSVAKNVNASIEAQRLQNESQVARLDKIAENTEKRLEALRSVVEDRLKAIQTDNTQQLDKIRQTVDEKLQGTLEKRLGESFKQVSERLEQVHKGLGEMQTLASGVGDLKKVLSNVKTRGTWGEIQLGNLLEQMLSPQQFARDVATIPQSGERVEFAIKLPGRDDGQDVVWLPIDAKFPQEDYARLVEAQEAANPEAVEAFGKQLETQIRKCGHDICKKYIQAPHTTDFGIMFLPIEGLYAEVIRRIGLVEVLQRECRVIVAGPTTLAAILNSLQMGFKTLAIQKQSSEVWSTLGLVKTEFEKFGGVLDSVQKKLQEASNKIDETKRRSRAIEKSLRGVEALTDGEVCATPVLLPAELAEESLLADSVVADE